MKGRQIEWGVQSDDDDADGEPIYYTVRADEKDVRKTLHGDALKKLPPGTRYEIRRRLSSHYGRSHGMAWLRDEAMDAVEPWGRVPIKPEYQELEGYYLVGQYVTPT